MAKKKPLGRIAPMTTGERQRKIANDAGFPTYYAYRNAVAQAEGFGSYNEKRKVLKAAKSVAAGDTLTPAQSAVVAKVQTRQGRRARVNKAKVYGHGVTAAGYPNGGGDIHVDIASDPDDRYRQAALFNDAVWDISKRGKYSGTVVVSSETDDGGEHEDSYFDAGDGTASQLIGAVSWVWGDKPAKPDQDAGPPATRQAGSPKVAVRNDEGQGVYPITVDVFLYP